MIDPKTVCLFVPAGLSKFKMSLFERIGEEICRLGGSVIRHRPSALLELPEAVVPIVGCSVELKTIVASWKLAGRRFIYWDRGYCRRVFATHLPRGENGGMYRWHVNSFQMQRVSDVPEDRWLALKTEVSQWSRSGRHVVIAQPSSSYRKFHQIEDWTDRTVEKLALVTDRQLVVRGKESKRTLQQDLQDAHALVTHGSNAAVEAVFMGCPVFVDRESAAALVGETDLGKIETPGYADRDSWFRSLAYSQFSEKELVDGTLWRLLS